MNEAETKIAEQLLRLQRLNPNRAIEECGYHGLILGWEGTSGIVGGPVHGVVSVDSLVIFRNGFTPEAADGPWITQLSGILDKLEQKGMSYQSEQQKSAFEKASDAFNKWPK